MDFAPAGSTQPAATLPVVTLDIAIHVVNAKRAGRAPGEPSPHKEPTELRRTLARNLRLAREAAQLTQRGLARAASCDPGVIAIIEASAANTTLDILTRLTHALGLTELDLLLPNLEYHERLKHVVTRPRGPRSKTEPTELQRRLARNLHAKRQKANLLQKELAKRAGISLWLIGDIERHCQNVRLDTVTQLAKSLGCNETDLLGPAPADC